MQMRLAGISNMENRLLTRPYAPDGTVRGCVGPGAAAPCWRCRPGSAVRSPNTHLSSRTSRRTAASPATAPGQGRSGREAYGSLRKWRPGASSGAAGSPPASTAAFAQGLSSPAYHAAVERCRELGILSEHVQAEQIPRMIADRVFAVGMMFSSPQEADRKLILSNREEECYYEIRALIGGCGRIATNHIKAVLNNHLELSAVCDVKPEGHGSAAGKHGLEQDTSIRRYTDYKEMGETEKPTLVGIATEKRHPRRDRALLHRPRRQRHHRKAHGHVHG